MSTGVDLSIAAVLGMAFTATAGKAGAWLRRRRQTALAPEPQAPQPVANPSAILVLVTRAASTAHALGMACALAKERGAEVILASIIVVPLSLPLDASIEDMETESAQALASARDTALAYGVPVRLLVRHGRSMASGLLAAVQESHPELMVIGVGPSQEDVHWGEMAEKVAARAGCEVIIDGLPGHGAGGEVRSA
jgi:Universal stress protein family